MSFDIDNIDFGSPTSPLIYDFTPLREDYRIIDFKTSLDRRLHPVEQIEFGNILRVDYYDAPNGNIVVSERNEYVYQVPGIINSLVQVRTKTFIWYNRDGTEAELRKVVTKVYGLDQALLAASKRRATLVRRLETEIFGIAFQIFQGDIAATSAQARSLRLSIAEPVREFLESGSTPSLIRAFEDDVAHEWLNADIFMGATARQIAISRIL